MSLEILIITDSRLPVFCADDRIFLGEGLFETIRIEEGKAIYSQLHWERMRNSAKKLGIFFDLSFDKWSEYLNLSICKAHLVNGGIKVLLSGGPAKRGLIEIGDPSILSFNAFDYVKTQEPLRLVSAKWLRDAKNPIYQFKSINYLEAILARRGAIDSGADDALFFNLDLFATETTIANLFIVYQGKICTPRISDGILPGVMREQILKLCASAEIDCIETSISRQMLYQAEAMFTVNVLQGLKAVSSFDNHQFSIRHAKLVMLEKLLQIS